MNAEAQIVAQLSASLDKLEEHEASKYPLPATEPDEQAPNESPLDPIRAKFELMEFFNIPAWARTSPDVETKISAIMEWAQTEAGVYSYVENRQPELGDLLKVINDRLRIMGAARDGDRIGRLWLYTRIQSQRRTLDQKERALNV